MCKLLWTCHLAVCCQKSKSWGSHDPAFSLRGGSARQLYFLVTKKNLPERFAGDSPGVHANASQEVLLIDDRYPFACRGGGGHVKSVIRWRSDRAIVGPNERRQPSAPTETLPHNVSRRHYCCCRSQQCWIVLKLEGKHRRRGWLGAEGGGTLLCGVTTYWSSYSAEML